MKIGETRTFLLLTPPVFYKLVVFGKIQIFEVYIKIEGIVTTAVRIKELVNQKNDASKQGWRRNSWI